MLQSVQKSVKSRSLILFASLALLPAILVLRNSLGDSLPQEPMVAAAQAFLDSLSRDLQTKAVIPFNDEERYDWHYVPRSRRGVSLKAMNFAQRNAGLNLLRSALSSKGYEKSTGIFALEEILGEIEGNGYRDPGLYFFTIFGTPSVSQPWGWRLEGHHLSLNFSSVTNELTAQQSTTPAFFGAHPATIPFGPKKGHRILAAEEDLARELVISFDDKRRSQAAIAVSAPRDITTGSDRKARLAKFEGLDSKSMDEKQQTLLLQLVEVYVLNMRADLANAQMEKIRRAGIENIYFAWAGGLKPGTGHYYRIHGPTFLIEYDNSQNSANHIHSVWRDLEDDFGEDLLRQHYETSKHD